MNIYFALSPPNFFIWCENKCAIFHQLKKSFTCIPRYSHSSENHKISSASVCMSISLYAWLPEFCSLVNFLRIRPIKSAFYTLFKVPKRSSSSLITYFWQKVKKCRTILKFEEEFRVLKWFVKVSRTCQKGFQVKFDFIKSNLMRQKFIKLNPFQHYDAF